MFKKHTLNFLQYINESSAIGLIDRTAYKKIYDIIKKLYPNVYSVLFDRGGDLSSYTSFSQVYDIIVNGDKWWIITRISYKTLKPFQNKEDGSIDDIAVIIADKKEFDNYKNDGLFPEKYLQYKSRYPISMIDLVTSLGELRTPAKINFSKQ
jgi:hypothetical protein